MIAGNSHPTLASAYLSGLQDLLSYGSRVESVKDPTSVASGFGQKDRPAIELIGYSFEVSDPRACLFLSSLRTVRLPYAFGLLLWSLAGSDSLNWIEYYDQRAGEFSDDGAHLCGAFGKRLFRFDGELNQVEVILQRLRDDPASRRAFCAVCSPADNFSRSREYPCCIGLQFFVRSGALHCITFMRAQSAMMVLPYDAFLFMSLQCLLSAQLGLRVGTYRHVVGTFHIYEAEKEYAAQIVEEDLTPVVLGVMESLDDQVPRLLAMEAELRQVEVVPRTYVDSSYNLSLFLDQVKLVLVTHALLRTRQLVDLDRLIARVEGPMKTMMDNYLRLVR
jgi:thymidylate synthase